MPSPNQNRIPIDPELWFSCKVPGRRGSAEEGLIRGALLVQFGIINLKLPRSKG